MDSGLLIAEVRARLQRLAVLMLLIVAVGTLGFVYIEGWSVIDSLYMTVITLSTVGFGEVQPLSPIGRLHTILLIIAGVGAAAFFVSTITRYVVSGELRGTLRRGRMLHRISRMSGHYIICGFGRVGRQTARDLAGQGKSFVIIESDADKIATMGSDVPHIVADASSDDVLSQAGIQLAKGLVAATGDDATNIFITLTAHTMVPNLSIVARANQPSTEPKLVKAGATHVISPYAISGRRIATQLIHPSVADFLDVVMHSLDLEFWLEDIPLGEASPLSGITLIESNIHGETGATVLAIRRGLVGPIITNPGPNVRFETGDRLIALGTRNQLEKLTKLAGA